MTSFLSSRAGAEGADPNVGPSIDTDDTDDKVPSTYNNNYNDNNSSNFHHCELYSSPHAGRGLRARVPLWAGQLLFVVPTIRVPAEQ